MEPTSGSSASPQNSGDATSPATTDATPRTNTSESNHENGAYTHFNPRSCTTCRRRKVKCDKRSPCSNCARSRVSCIYPGPERAPRRPRKSADAELLARVKKLEGMVQNLGGGPEAEDFNGTVAQDDEQQAPDESPMSDGLELKLGRLVVGEGKSRYVASNLWASLSEQVEDIKEILNETSDEEDYPSPESGNSSSLYGHHGFIFGFSSVVVDLRRLHPPPCQILVYWQTFKDGIDPLIKAVHIPTIEPLVVRAKDSLEDLSRGFEALLFAIYFAAVTSLTAQECRDVIGEEKITLLSKYRFGVEQALARAGFLNTQELVLLQAFVIFLICVRRYDDSRIVWTLTGLAIRIAQSLGLHRDGTVFDLSPYETEMRRRVWWNICVLDLRTAEDYGSDPTIAEPNFDTKLPSNINDSDFNPDSTEYPESRLGCTEMTFCLLRYEVSNTLRNLDYVPPGASDCQTRAATFTLQQKEQSIEECHKRLEEKYLKYCDMTVPLYWVTATVARLIMAKMWLILYHPFQRPGSGVQLPQQTRDRLLVTSIEVIEYSRLLETEKSTMKWGWLFRTYVQWHAMAYLLAELCNRTKGEVADRAWNAVSGVFESWGEADSASKKGMLWGPLRKLEAKAKQAREAEQARDRAIADLNMNSTSNLMPFTPDVSSISCTGTDLSSNSESNNNNNNNDNITMNTGLFSSPPVLSPNQNSTAEAGLMNNGIQPDMSWSLNDDMGNDISNGNNNHNFVAPEMADDIVNWAGWENMVKDYQVELDQQDPNQAGPVLGGMGYWW